MSTAWDSRFERQAQTEFFDSEEFTGTIEPVNTAGVYVARLTGKQLGTIKVLQNRSHAALLKELHQRLRHFRMLPKDTRSSTVNALDQQVAQARANMIAAGEGRRRIPSENVPQAPQAPKEFGEGVSDAEREGIAAGMWGKFLSRHPEYLEANNSNIAQVVQSMGWARTSENYEKAWQYLRDNDMLIRPLKRGERMIQPFRPPTPQRILVQNEAEDLKTLRTMPLDQLAAQVQAERNRNKPRR